MKTRVPWGPLIWIQIAVVLVIVTVGPIAARQDPAPVAVEFPAGDDIIRGRFFATAAATPLATLALIPGFGGTMTDVLELGARLSAREVNVLIFNNRGVQNSDGTLTYANALDDDIHAWLVRTTPLAMAGRRTTGDVSGR